MDRWIAGKIVRGGAKSGHPTLADCGAPQCKPPSREQLQRRRIASVCFQAVAHAHVPAAIAAAAANKQPHVSACFPQHGTWQRCKNMIPLQYIRFQGRCRGPGDYKGHVAQQQQRTEVEVNLFPVVLRRCSWPCRRRQWYRKHQCLPGAATTPRSHSQGH